jgi:hypothetical protein
MGNDWRMLDFAANIPILANPLKGGDAKLLV